MKIHRILFATFLFALPGWAQAGPATGAPTSEVSAQNANNLCRIWFSTPKPGILAQYEAGRKKHVQFHRAQKDTFALHTWVIVTGENTGTFVTSTCGHSWKDFDEFDQRLGKADDADAVLNIEPNVSKGHNAFYVLRADLSLAPAEPIAPMSAVTIYRLHPGAAPEFTAAVQKLTAALAKSPDWPKVSFWLQLVNGGETPTFVLLSGRQNWAEFAAPAKSPFDILNQSLGKAEVDAAMKSIRDATAHLYTEAAKYRPDLSYVPGK